MKKKLPQPKKTLKSFILEEDAKVIDKTMTKVALTASFLSINFAIGMDDANAKGHANHSDHSNYVAHEGENTTQTTSGNTGVMKDDSFGNDNETSTSRTYTISGKTVEIDLGAKTITSAHANHYNHTNGSGKS